MDIIDTSTASLAEFKKSISETTSRMKEAVGIIEENFMPEDNGHHEGAFSAAHSDETIEADMPAREVDIFGWKI